MPDTLRACWGRCIKDAAITEAIETVYRSYVEGDFTEEAKQQLIEANEEVLIQRQTDHVRISGVVFTRDIIYNRPYYMVTYDDNGSTDSVTSGVRGKTKWIAKMHPESSWNTNL